MLPWASRRFRRVRSRLRADALPKTRLSLAPLAETDWSDVRRVFDASERRRPAALLRDTPIWRGIAGRAQRGGSTNFAVRRRGRVVAYVLGDRRPERDAFVLDEFGFADDAAVAEVPALLRAAAGDLRRVTGWLPVDGARDALPSLSVRRRTRAILMMAPLHRDARSLIEAIASAKRGDFCWPIDHV